MTSLNPVLPVGDQISEVFRRHEKLKKTAAKEKSVDMIKLVGISRPELVYKYYPHMLSGGMRQRIMIAIALACDPDLLIADEPTTALDVTIQAQILELMDKLIRKRGTSMILITHDLGVVAESADKVIIMYAGKAVEKAPVNILFSNPAHPYTTGLLASLPDMQGNKTLYSIPGSVPNLLFMPPGCAFCPRCPRAVEKCGEVRPDLIEISPGHFVSCHQVQGRTVI
jgi:oligopeptide/dipeptide ABC transporter ATP-binding protein